MPSNSSRPPFVDTEERADRIIESLTIGAHGSAWQILGWDGVAQTWTPNQENAEYVLNSIRFRNELELDGIVVWGNETERYEALNSIVAYEVTVQGEAEMQARYSVDLKSEFHAVQGSEFHAFAAPVELDCADLTTVNLKAAAGSSAAAIQPTSDIPEELLEMDLVFHLDQPTTHVSIHPNPSRRFQVTISGMKEGRNAWTALRVYDEQGALILDQGFSGKQGTIDMAGEAPGCYNIHLIQDTGHQTTHTIVVN